MVGGDRGVTPYSLWVLFCRNSQAFFYLWGFGQGVFLAIHEEVMVLTEKQEARIAHMRRMGESYGKIAECLDLSCNTVKSFCRRNNLGGRKHTPPENQSDTVFCACCGKEVPQQEHRKLKKFCSDDCRRQWWREHQYLISRKSTVTFHCRNCGREFSDYSNADRKFCCHDCYITYRFGGRKYEPGAVSKGKAVSGHHVASTHPDEKRADF